MTPLMHAAHVGNNAMIEILLKYGANINATCSVCTHNVHYDTFLFIFPIRENAMHFS